MRCTELINSETPDGLVWNQIMDGMRQIQGSVSLRNQAKRCFVMKRNNVSWRSSLKCCELFLSFCVRACTWEALAAFFRQSTHLRVYYLQRHIPMSYSVWDTLYDGMCHHISVRDRIYPASCWVPSPSTQWRLAVQGTLQDLFKVKVIII